MYKRLLLQEKASYKESFSVSKYDYFFPKIENFGKTI